MSDRKIKQLITKLKANTSAEAIKAKRGDKIVELGLINQYALHDLIPNKWFDWERRANAEIMIIGQDWGPYQSLKKYLDEYQELKTQPNFNYDDFLFSRFSSRTEKFILKVIEETYKQKFNTFNQNIFNTFFFTMAVLFTRRGTKFRGNENFDQNQSFELSYPYLSEQIDAVHPKVIVTLGNLAFQAINRKYNLGYEHKNITSVINSVASSNGVIKLPKVTIIPNYHPAAHINPTIQKEIWKKIWDNLE